MISRAGLVLFLVLTAAAAAADPYRIGPGDVVDLQVWREVDLSGTHEIDEAGNLRHVLVGAVPATGLTCDELAAEIVKLLEKDYLRRARVIVTLEKSARRKAWILGAVDRPGSFPIGEGARLLDLVFSAGGVSENSDGRARVYRMGEPGPDERERAPSTNEPLEEFDVDLAALLAGDLAANHGVEPGDVVVVGGSPSAVGAPASAARVRVVGEVEAPGSYALTDAPTALDAVLAAGGFTEYASKNRSRLVRGSGQERVEEKIRLGDVLEGRKGAENIDLQPGDLIVVPESFF